MKIKSTKKAPPSKNHQTPQQAQKTPSPNQHPKTRQNTRPHLKLKRPQNTAQTPKNIKSTQNHQPKTLEKCQKAISRLFCAQNHKLFRKNTPSNPQQCPNSSKTTKKRHFLTPINKRALKTAKLLT